MNVELLQKVKAAILAKPQTYRQVYWCGTEHCIAGHAVAIAQPKTWARALKLDASGDDRACDLVEKAARKLLRLDNEKFWRLCGGAGDWPSGFAERYFMRKTKRGKAAVAASYIDAFIAAKGDI